MSSISKRKTKSGAPRWVVRWRDPADDTHHEKWFDDRTIAAEYKLDLHYQMSTGTYVGPNAGKVLVRVWAEKWRLSLPHASGTARQLETNFRRHLYPSLGDRRLDSIAPRDIQEWIVRLTKTLSPGTIKIITLYTKAMFTAAVDDRLLHQNPCDHMKVPRVQPKHVIPLEVEQVLVLEDEIHPRYRGVITTTAGTGLRRGEVFGLTVPNVDFLRRTISVNQQLQDRDGELRLVNLKSFASNRTIPVPQWVLDAIAAQLAEFGEGPDRLIFTTHASRQRQAGQPVRSSVWSPVWRPAADAAGINRGKGLHELRHFYASVLIDNGCSVLIVQKRLGHASATETLDTYGHLFLNAADKTRDALEGLLDRDGPARPVGRLWRPITDHRYLHQPGEAK